MASHTPPPSTAPPYRWIICALLFLATTINYVDRQLLGILAPTLQSEIGWSEIDYANIVTSFQCAYAIGLVGFGWLIDRIGSRIGLILAVSLWSVSSSAHAFASSVFGFACARFGLGISEAGNFPASIKAVSEWFPNRERAFAIGIFNSGSNVGAIITPLLVPWIALTWGWRSAFLFTGALGILWIVAALALFSSPDQCRFLSSERRASLSEDNAPTTIKTPWRSVASRRETWAFAIAKFLTDPIWWFFLYWAPKYLSSQFGVQLAGLAAPLVVIYVMADLGSILGGWASSRLIKRGFPVLAARQRVMLWCASAALMVIYAPTASNLWVAVILLGLATAAHQAWSANLFATVSDIFPKEEVASVVGIGGTLGAVGGMIIATVTGIALETTGSYLVPFIMCSSAYLVAWFLFRIVGNTSSVHYR
jgi:ACS family hexuronate transporter-like MFS transporter